MYNAGNAKAALSVLSDALHQAEDRGSHEEGEEFHGHDIRQTINAEKYFKDDWKKEGYRYKPKPDPDNASFNSPGAKKALFLTSQALNLFLDLIGQEQVTYTKDKKTARKRHSKIDAKLLGKLVATSSKIKTKMVGTTEAGTIKKIEKAEWSKEKDVEKAELSPEDQDILRRAIDTYVIGWLTSELMEKIRKKDPSLKKLRDFAYKTFDAMIKKNAKMVGIYEPISKKERKQLVEAAIKNYRYQRALRYQSTEPAKVMEDF